MVVRSLTCAAILIIPALAFADAATEQNQRLIDQQQSMLQAQQASDRAQQASATAAFAMQEQQRQQQALAERRAYLYEQEQARRFEETRQMQNRAKQMMQRRAAPTTIMSKDWRTLRKAVGRYRPGVRRIGVLVKWLTTGLPVESEESEHGRSFSRITHGPANEHFRWHSLSEGAKPYNFANPAGGVMNPATNPTAPVHRFNFNK